MNQILSPFFVGGIAVWAVWAIFNAKVRDGIFGRLIYWCILVSAYGVILGGHSIFITPTTAGTAFLGSLCAAGIRHIVVVMWWADVRAWLCRKFECEDAIHRDDRRVKVERRKG